MANSPSTKPTGWAKYGDLKGRLIFLLLALVVYRIGAHVPVPGIDPDMLRQLFNEQQGGILGLFNMFSGGALSRFSVFALGIMPYISASIIMQMLSYVLPSLEALRKEGEQGRRKITQYTRYGTLALGFFQAVGIAVALETQAGLVINPGMMFRFTCAVSLVTGTMFLMWLGEQITERGLGNGISIIIFAGIVAGLPSAASGLFQLVSTGAISPLAAIFVIAVVVVVTAFVVFIERGQRRITVNYARRQIGNRIYGGQASYLPLKMNMSGVIPPIFASSLILFPLDSRSGSGSEPRPAALHSSLCCFDHLLCFLLHGIGFQSEGNCRESEKEWCVCSGHPSGRTDFPLHRQGARAPDVGRCSLPDICLLGSGIPEPSL